MDQLKWLLIIGVGSNIFLLLLIFNAIKEQNSQVSGIQNLLLRHIRPEIFSD